jgi:hypothetical protein
MGSVARVFKKVTKAVTKPISKAFKGVAKGIMKVGKATMRGVAKLNKKLGPLGSIALAVAMPYALGGLSTMTTAAMNSTNTFLKAIGTVGNQIRTGYQAFNAGVGKAFTSITSSIKQGFTKFAPKGTGNIFTKISNGAKNLYNSAKNISKKYSPFKGKQGTVQVSDGLDQVYTLTSDEASKQLAAGTLDVSQINQQTLGSNKWFVQGSKQSDKLITDTINEAYKGTTSQYSDTAKRYFNDLKTKAIENRTYINDSDIGSMVDNYSTNIQTGTADLGVTSSIDVDLTKTGDYNILNEEGTEFAFNGNKSFAKAPDGKFKSIMKKSNVSSIAKGILTKSKDQAKEADFNLAYTFGDGSNNITDLTGTYGGTDLYGSAGGQLLKNVYSDVERNRIMNYYKNMNIIGSN